MKCYGTSVYLNTQLGGRSRNRDELCFVLSAGQANHENSVLIYFLDFYVSFKIAIIFCKVKYFFALGVTAVFKSSIVSSLISRTGQHKSFKVRITTQKKKEKKEKKNPSHSVEYQGSQVQRKEQHSLNKQALEHCALNNYHSIKICIFPIF